MLGSICKASHRNNQSIIVKFYGDGNLIYTSPVISFGTKATSFDIDVSDYKVLKIHAEIPNLTYSGNAWPSVGLADARLEKK